MSVGFDVLGICYPSEPQPWLTRAQEWFEHRANDAVLACFIDLDESDEPTLYVDLHPGGSPLLVTKPNANEVRIMAQTSSVGPGFHMFLCDLCRDFGQEFDIRWMPEDDEADASGDETGYFYSGDKQAVFDSMLQWLIAVGKYISERHDETLEYSIAMPTNYYYQHDGKIVTQLGPREITWFQAVMDNEDIGREFFPWWKEGKNADYYLGRALCHMWTDVRWREPLTEQEEELNSHVLNMLSTAFKLEPSLSYPWREWHQLLSFSGRKQNAESEFIAAKAVECNGPLIGYRREAITVYLNGVWSIDIPGSFAEMWEEDGTFCAWDSSRTVRVSSFIKEDATEQETADHCLFDIIADKPDMDIKYRSEQVSAAAKVTYDNKQKCWILSGVSAAPSNFVLTTICFEEESDREWVVEIWQSIDFVSSSGTSII